jgi:hypothetical protein
VHPVHPDYAGISQTEIMGPLARHDGVLHARNAVVVRPGRLDRSACGTGTSARLAVLHARGEIAVGEPLVHESVLGSQYTGTIVSTTGVGGIPAIVPSIAGQAWITDIAQLGIDPTDPFPEGYTLSDTWGPVPPPRFPDSDAADLVTAQCMDLVASSSALEERMGEPTRRRPGTFSLGAGDRAAHVAELRRWLDALPTSPKGAA